MELDKISSGTPEKFNVLIEIPQGGGNKYEIDEASGFLRLDFVYRDGLSCPFNYGFIPHTLAEDKDPLDVMLFSTSPVDPYVVVTAKPIGILKLTDRGEQDSKILAVPVVDPLAEKLNDIGDISQAQKTELINFWLAVARQKQKIIVIEDFFGKEEAIKEISKDSIKIA